MGARLFYLGNTQYNQYATEAINNSVTILPLTPQRGIIMDRNGIVLAKNYTALTLEITRSNLQNSVPEVLKELAKIVLITPKDRHKFARALSDAKLFEPVILRNDLNESEVAAISARAYKFPGVAIGTRLLREYPQGQTATSAVGYVSRLSSQDRINIKDASDANDENLHNFNGRLEESNYNGTDFIGKVGVEQSYETQLHGVTGFEKVEVTATGKPVRVISKTLPQPGEDLELSIDVGLQRIAEKAFAGHKGALVAIQPATGEILAFVSAPSYDPNWFANGIDEQDWQALSKSTDRPLLNRPLRGTYAPGSTYKPFMALAALTLHARTRDWGFEDPGFYFFGGHKFRNDVIAGQGWINMFKSIVVSNDTYYYMLAHDLGVDAIASFMVPWGFGQKTGIDLTGEAIGILPSTHWKREAFKNSRMQRWFDGETISLGIGQGYNSFTILQLAHAVATLANNGVVERPHLVRKIFNPATRNTLLTNISPQCQINVTQSDLAFIRSAMVAVGTQGLAKKVFAGARYSAGVKTGTAQVIGIAANKRYNANALRRDLRDNSLFEAFAPAEHPTIALAIVVENGGWGVQSAGPIARKVLDYYLVDRLRQRSQMKNAAADNNKMLQ